MKQLWQKFNRSPLPVIFGILMLVIFCADMIISRKDFSELENRKLAATPYFDLGRVDGPFFF